MMRTCSSLSSSVIPLMNVYHNWMLSRKRRAHQAKTKSPRAKANLRKRRAKRRRASPRTKRRARVRTRASLRKRRRRKRASLRTRKMPRSRLLRPKMMLKWMHATKKEERSVRKAVLIWALISQVHPRLVVFLQRKHVKQLRPKRRKMTRKSIRLILRSLTQRRPILRRRVTLPRRLTQRKRPRRTPRRTLRPLQIQLSSTVPLSRQQRKLA